MSRRICTINDKYLIGFFFSFYNTTQIFEDCWKVSAHDRPTFSELFEQINAIIEINYNTNGINHMEPNEESYQSLQKDWREEIQDMFKELKDKEQVK